MMKKKNKFFDSGADIDIPQRDKGMEELDIEKIIKEKIVVMERKDTKDEKMSIEANNISSIEKREDENSEFNEEVSPSWFNIQNQRFDISSVNSDFDDNWFALCILSVLSVELDLHYKNTSFIALCYA